MLMGTTSPVLKMVVMGVAGVSAAVVAGVSAAVAAGLSVASSAGLFVASVAEVFVGAAGLAVTAAGGGTTTSVLATYTQRFLTYRRASNSPSKAAAMTCAIYESFTFLHPSTGLVT
jgi:hypothetical protein